MIVGVKFLKIKSIFMQDFRLLIRDKSTFLILILMPTILVMILGSVFSSNFSMTMDAFDVAFLTEDTPGQPPNLEVISFGKALRDNVLKSDDIQRVIKLKEVSSKDEGIKLVEGRKVSAFIYVPKNFTTLYLNGRQTEIELIGDNGQSTQLSIVRGIVEGFNERLRTTEVSMNEISRQAQIYGVQEEKLREIINKMSDVDHYENTPIQLQKQAANNRPPVSATQYYSIAMVAMYALFTAQTLIQSMIEEKKNKTYFRIQASPISKIEYILGKLFGIVFVMVIQMSILVSITYLLFGLKWGNLGSIFIITIVYAFALGAITLFLGFIAEDDSMISNLSMPLVFVFSFFGGSFIPKEIMPDFAKQIQGFVPNGQALIAYLNIVQGGSINDFYKSVLILTATGLVFLIIASLVASGKGWSNGSIVRNNQAPDKAIV